MKSLIKAHRLLKKKYKCVKLLLPIEHSNVSVHFFKVEENRVSKTKIAVYIKNANECIIYDACAEKIILAPTKKNYPDKKSKNM
jgi:hypothetical protein